MVRSIGNKKIELPLQSLWSIDELHLKLLNDP